METHLVPFEDWDKLSYGIRRGDCVLFLGPELPLTSAGGERKIATDLLAEILVEELGRKGHPTDDLRPRDISQIVQRYLRHEDEIGLELKLEEWHRQLGSVASPLHDDLAALPFRWIVSSGHDPLMEAALRRAHKDPCVERYDYRGQNKELLPEATVSSPVLFHLYGHVSEPRSVVIADTQLLDFLVALIGKQPPLPNDLNDALTNGRMFLFLGFGLRHWYLRILLHVLKILRGKRSTIAIETVDDAVTDDADDAILFYRDNFERIDIRNEDAEAFVRELRGRCGPADGEAASASTPATRAPQPDGGPTVFLCHAKANKEAAQRIYEHLRRMGCRPWLDEKNLRGGDRWDDLIEKTIEGVDYFVVLNSRELAAKEDGRSYVNKEIAVALRADEWIGREFIIPVRLDDTPLPRKLEKLHWVDLSKGQDEGLRDLVRAIRRQEGAA